MKPNCTRICAIVFDEGHAATASAGFRPIMKQVHKLMRVQVPIIFITGTLPPRLVEHFKESTRLPADCRYIRSRTNRPEHRYNIKHFKIADTNKLCITISKLAMVLAHQLRGTERGLVFVPTMEIGEELSVQLEAPFISSRMKEEQERALCIRDWEDGQTGGLLVGTSSLIQGVHYDKVKFVVFAGAPHGMIDLVQGAGRAGRDGEPAWILVVDMKGTSKEKEVEKNDPQCYSELKEWLRGGKCLRMGISSTMDGVENEVSCEDVAGAQQCAECSNGDGDATLEEAWAKAMNPKFHPPNNKNLTLTAYRHHLENSPFQLPVPASQPRPPHRSVINHSVEVCTGVDLLEENTNDIFNRIVGVGLTCGYCWMLDHWEGKKGEKPSSHKSVSECAQYRKGAIPGGLYDCNKPADSSKQQKGTVRADNPFSCYVAADQHKLTVVI
jgi:Helicase conserved C-terminal domain